MSGGPERFTDAARLAERIVSHVGRRVVLALPLGLGKPCHVADALFDLARRDGSVELIIYTGLTLEAPPPGKGMAARFAGPLLERLFAGYPGLAYARALREGSLPANVTVHEFFLLAGRWLGDAHMQRNYVSANYTHVARYLSERGVNVLAQLVAARGSGARARYSLSCNPDVTLDLLPAVDEWRAAGRKVAFVAQVNPALPFFAGHAALPADRFDYVLDHERYHFPLFAPPKPEVRLADHAAGLHAAGFVKDGGTLQIGIGSGGDALAHALILRQQKPDAYRAAMAALGAEPAEAGPFKKGLFGCSEMLADSFLDLMEAGVVKRKAGDGAVVHAGFFVGPAAFYERLRAMSDKDRARISMRGIHDINQLHDDEARKRKERVDARFVNNAMMATLLGAVVSDGLENGQVVSGVGGQFDFISQAFALQGARAVITLKATRGEGGALKSNILWSYGNATIPRHLRDIVVTEYGSADLRWASDRDCVARMLAIADSRFQEELLDAAKEAGKIEPGYRIPDEQRNNLPERIEAALNEAGGCRLFPAYPFGTDLTVEEQLLTPALRRLKAASASRTALARLALTGFGMTGLGGRVAPDHEAALARMGLGRPAGFSERLERAALLGALRREGEPD